MTFLRASPTAMLGPCDRRDRRRQGRGPRRPGSRGADDRFNHWLDERLRRLYERELAEPIPDDMLELLKKIESAE